MRAREAKKLCLLLWQDIADHGYIDKKESKYYDQIKSMHNFCPLCEYWHVARHNKGCTSGCPLYEATGKLCMDAGSLYNNYIHAVVDNMTMDDSHNTVMRDECSRAAQAIVNAVKKWRV